MQFLTSVNGGAYSSATANTICFIASFTGQAANSLQDCVINAGTLTGGDNYSFEMQVTDGATTPELQTSSASPNIIVANVPHIVSFTPSNVLLDAGQKETYAITLDSNGFGPFVIELYNITGGRQQGSNALIPSPGGSNAITFTSGAAGTFSYNAIAQDTGANELYMFSYPANAIAVYNTPTISIYSNKISLNAGGGALFMANVPSGVGVGPFTVNLVIGGTTVANTVIPSNGGNFSYGYTFNTIGTFSVQFTAVDTGTTTPFAFVSNTILISVGSATGTGGGGTSGASSGGGGGPSAPIVLNTSNGYNVSNVAQLNTFTLSNLCGQQFKVTDNFITPNYTGITIGNNTYDLYTGKPKLIAGTSTCYAEVSSISYLPILVSVNFLFYNTNLNATNTIDLIGSQVHANVSITNTTPINLNINDGNLLLTLLASRSARENISVMNITNATLPAPPANTEAVRIIKINMTSGTTPKPTTYIKVTEGYSCTLPSSRLRPYILVNGSWQAILPYSIDSAACTITYNITTDPIIALFISLAPATTTTLPTTTATTTASTTSIPAGQQGQQALPTEYIVAAIVAIMILIAVYEYIRRRGDIPTLKT